jgi:hypothetical protein
MFTSKAGACRTGALNQILGLKIVAEINIVASFGESSITQKQKKVFCP